LDMVARLQREMGKLRKAEYPQPKVRWDDIVRGKDPSSSK